MFDDNFFLIMGTIFLVMFITSNKTEKFSQNGGSSEMLNIYDEKLEPCDEGNMGSGSWDSNGKCSELGGGIHQICFKELGNKANDFSLNTGQNEWSRDRKSNNHCVCLGAWALYVSKKNKGEIKDNNSNQLKCSAIPKVSLSKDYVGKFQGWDKWNGLELDGQTKDGVEELVNQCYNQGNKIQKNKLISNYCKFANQIEGLKNSSLFKNYC